MQNGFRTVIVMGVVYNESIHSCESRQVNWIFHMSVRKPSSLRYVGGITHVPARA